MERLPRITAAVLLASMALLAGCQTSHPNSRSSPQWEQDGYYRPRSPYFLPKPILAFDSAELHKRAQTAGLDDANRPLAWYDGRADRGPTAYAGFAGPTHELTYTQVYDRQHQHNGQVRDHYSSYTRRVSVTERVR